MEELVDKKLEEKIAQERESQNKEMGELYNKKLEERLEQK